MSNQDLINNRPWQVNDEPVSAPPWLNDFVIPVMSTTAAEDRIRTAYRDQRQVSAQADPGTGFPPLQRIPTREFLSAQFNAAFASQAGKRGSEYQDRSRVQLEMLAVKYGCDCVWAEENQLLIDVDLNEGDSFDSARFHDCVERIKHCFNCEAAVVSWTSRNGGMHIQIQLSALAGTLSDADVCFLQMYLGSDPQREFLNWQRVLLKNEGMNVLFRPIKKEATGE